MCSDAAGRVARGVALLDACTPGWHHRIDLATLDLGDAYMCIVGQLAGDYVLGVRALRQYANDHNLGPIHACTHGFADCTGTDETEWRRIIAARREADTPTNPPAAKELAHV